MEIREHTEQNMIHDRKEANDIRSMITMSSCLEEFFRQWFMEMEPEKNVGLAALTIREQVQVGLCTVEHQRRGGRIKGVSISTHESVAKY